MTTLLVEPFGGFAGDMFLAALLDLRDPRFTLADLERLAERLVPGECRLALTEAERGSLRALHLAVETPETARDHRRDHDHGHDHAHAPHRHLADLVGLLESADLSPQAFARARAVLGRIAVAEGHVHGIDPEEVHFHEVGAVDTLIDVAGAVLALELLGVTRVVATPPLVGEGTVLCAHGEMPVPAPGTAEIARGMPLRFGGGGGERLTPTGAALLAELVDEFDAMGEFRASRLGTGAGTRDPRTGPPNLCRVQLGDAAAERAGPEVLLLEFNLDDTTGEEIGYCVEALRSAGALEVWTTPVQMKKDRPGVVVSLLCRPGAEVALERIAFDTTPTLGVRRTRFQRTECGRETLEVELHGQVVRVKLRLRPAGGGGSMSLGGASALDLSPEFDDLARVARATGRPLRELEREAIDLALRL